MTGRWAAAPKYMTSGRVHHDPEPYTGTLLRWDGNDSGPYRFERPPVTEGWEIVHDPRPEFDNHNPILVAFRGHVSEPGADPDHIWDSTMEWLAHAHESDPFCVRTGIRAAHMKHAERVLSKLDALWAVTR